MSLVAVLSTTAAQTAVRAVRSGLVHHQRCLSPSIAVMRRRHGVREVTTQTSVVAADGGGGKEDEKVNEGDVHHEGVVHATMQAWDVWRDCEAVAFDVDSTVISEEGIDAMAEWFGTGKEVAEMTLAAMEGGMPFHEALDKRLAVMQPTRDGMKSFMESSPINLTPGIKELFQELHKRGKKTFLVSGGFREVIEPIADMVGVPRENIFANRINFKEEGDYHSFDATEPTSKAGGKAKVVQELKSKHGFRSFAMVGDGATDLEARQPGGADVFVGFGGVAERAAVRQGADIFIRDFEALKIGLDRPAGKE